MNADDGNLYQASETSAAKPTGPPVDPEERPRIEPSDALPTGDDDERSLTEKAKSLFTDGEPAEDPRQPATTTTGAEPTPPPVSPAERPRIEPSDARPDDDK